MSEQLEKERFERLLTSYVCGRLDAGDRLWMDRFVEEHPEFAVQLDIERCLRRALQDEMPDVSADQGLDAFMRRIQADSPAIKSLQSEGWAATFWNNFKRSLALPMMKPVWVTMALLLIAQSGTIGLLLGKRGGQELGTEPAQWRSVGGEGRVRGPVLQITFKPTATEAEMRLLLVKIGGVIVAGPGQLGHYIVKVPDELLETTASELQGNEILEAVELKPEIPKEE